MTNHKYLPEAKSVFLTIVMVYLDSDILFYFNLFFLIFFLFFFGFLFLLDDEEAYDHSHIM